MISFIRRLFRSSPNSEPKGRVRGRYDAAQTTKENMNHWSWADDLSADAANSPMVRQRLRRRSRYECDNNSYAAGLIETLANDTVGTGPRVQLDIPGMPSAIVKRKFAEWAKAIGLPEKLRQLHKCRKRDGEGFGLFVDNPKLNCAVTLDLRLYECDQVSTPDIGYTDPLAVDGLRLDTHGNVTEYHILRYHPGAPFAASYLDYDRYDSANIVHWFRRSRPGQHRGIPEITPAIPLFATLRRYTLAVLGAAEFAASISGVLESDLPPEDAEQEPTAFDDFPMIRNRLITMPGGWKAHQFKAEQPIQNYGDFKGEILNEIGRCLNCPFNVVAGNSSRYNYSSGRLDHTIYHQSIWIERDQMECEILGRAFRKWAEEALLIEGYLPEGLPPLVDWRITWHWDGFSSIDPKKDADAASIRLRAGQTTLSEICAAEGRDWEEVLTQRAIEVKKAIDLAKSFGIPEALMLDQEVAITPDEPEEVSA